MAADTRGVIRRQIRTLTELDNNGSANLDNGISDGKAEMKTDAVMNNSPMRIPGGRHNSVSTSASTRSSSPLPDDMSSSGGASSHLKMSSALGFDSATNSASTSNSVSPIPPPQFCSSGRNSNQNGNTKRTPIPSDSPLFAKPDASAAAASNHTADPAFQKIRNFNRNMRRAKTLRAHRKTTNEERNSIGHDGGFGLVGCVTDDGDVTFAIRRSQYGRKGWKVMPAAPPPSENLNNLMNLDMAVIERVMARIREIELSGHQVPELMTVKV